MTDIVKEFMRNQTESLSIGVPRARQPEDAGGSGPVGESAAVPQRKPVGRPSGTRVQKTQTPVYMCRELKEELVVIQHRLMKAHLNDVIVEALEEYVRRNGS